MAEARRRGIPVVYGVESVVNPSTVYEVTGNAPYTWAEHQAANQATLDEIAAAMGAKR
jgi:hypothetical protein